MKKFIPFLILSVLLTAVFCGCGKKTFDYNIVFISDSASVSDSEYNTAINKALDKLDGKAGITVMSYGNPSELTAKIDVAAEKNPGLIVLTPGESEEEFFAAAEKYPDIQFAALGSKTGGLYQNVTGLNINYAQCGYIAGYAAAACSGSPNLGFVGGADSQATRAAESGFRAGASPVDPGAVFHTVYAGSDTDDNAAYNAAKSLYALGADIIVACAKSAGDGVIRAAIDLGKKVIACGFDKQSLAPNNVVLSVTADYGKIVTGIAEKYIGGEDLGGTDYEYGVVGDYIQAVRNEELIETNKFATIKYCVNSLKDNTLSAPSAEE